MIPRTPPLLRIFNILIIHFYCMFEAICWAKQPGQYHVWYCPKQPYFHIFPFRTFDQVIKGIKSSALTPKYILTVGKWNIMPWLSGLDKTIPIPRANNHFSIGRPFAFISISYLLDIFQSIFFQIIGKEKSWHQVCATCRPVVL